MTGSEPGAGNYSPDDMVHRLPRARVVDRVDWTVEHCRDRRVVHIGFVDAGCQTSTKRWLHDHLAESASELVGIDIDAAGVDASRSDGYEAYTADCSDPGAIAALGLEPADVVVAGEVIEHTDRPGLLLDGLRHLCRPGGRLIVTTPNSYGLLNTAASTLLGVEINHPDHLVMFTWRTLSELVRRHGWRVVETVTYVPSFCIQDVSRLKGAAIQAIGMVERVLGRLGRPFAADGLIVVAEPV